MKKTIARLISFIFHPLVFILLTPFTIVYHGSLDFDYGIKWVIFSSIFVFLALFTFFFLRPTQFLTDFDISKRENRPLFYGVALFFALLYFVTSVILKGIFFQLSIVSLAIILGIVIFEGVNFYLKVSVHVAVVAAYVLTLGLLYGFGAFIVTVWMPIVVVWSRVYLKKHSKKEVLTGAVIGVMIPLLTFAVVRVLL